MDRGVTGSTRGTTVIAMAVMRTRVERSGAARRALPVAAPVGAFFIDFANAPTITGIIGFFG